MVPYRRLPLALCRLASSENSPRLGPGVVLNPRTPLLPSPCAALPGWPTSLRRTLFILREAARAGLEAADRKEGIPAAATKTSVLSCMHARMRAAGEACAEAGQALLCIDSTLESPK